MTWLFWVMLAVIVTGVAAVTGLKAKGTRHVAHTRLLTVGRIALIAIAIIVALIVARSMAMR